MTGFSQEDLRSACAAAYGLIAECEERMAAGEQLTDERKRRTGRRAGARRAVHFGRTAQERRIDSRQAGPLGLRRTVH